MLDIENNRNHLLEVVQWFPVVVDSQYQHVGFDSEIVVDRVSFDFFVEVVHIPRLATIQ